MLSKCRSARIAGAGIPELGWRLVFLMAGCLYIGNALKDLVCAPRPVGMQSGDYRPKLLASNAEAASYVQVRRCSDAPMAARAEVPNQRCSMRCARASAMGFLARPGQ